MVDDNFGSNSDTAELKEEESLPEEEKLDLSDEEDPYAADEKEEEENYMNFAVMKEMYPNGEQEYRF